MMAHHSVETMGIEPTACLQAGALTNELRLISKRLSARTNGLGLNLSTTAGDIHLRLILGDVNIGARPRAREAQLDTIRTAHKALTSPTFHIEGR